MFGSLDELFLRLCDKYLLVLRGYKPVTAKQENTNVHNQSVISIVMV